MWKGIWASFTAEPSRDRHNLQEEWEVESDLLDLLVGEGLSATSPAVWDAVFQIRGDASVKEVG